MELAGLSEKRAYVQVLGCLMLDPLLLDDSNLPLDKADFDTESFYRYIFVTIYNLAQQGVEKIDEYAIDSYLSNYQEQYEVFQANNGLVWVADAIGMAVLDNYEYWYHRVRKFSLLRFYEKAGFDTRVIYDGNKLDTSEENRRFDELTEQDIIDFVENKLVIEATSHFCTNGNIEAQMAGKGLKELKEELMKEPDVGLPLASPMLTTLTRGCRMGCLYLRGSIQGGGKTRIAAMDACKVSVPYYYDIKKKSWIYTGFCEPTVYIMTEQKMDEIQTILMAAISGVDEESIRYGKYKEGEEERVDKANEIIEQSPLILVRIPDFSIEDIKNVIKKYNREKGVRHFFFDYIFSSIKVMQNMGSKVGMGLKEHQFLLLFSNELKTICQQMDVFMFTACQLNGEVVDAKIKDNNILAGAKALGNKIDVGCNLVPPTAAELKKIEPIVTHMLNTPMPNMATWVYKLRSSRITRVIIWSYYDLGTMRCTDLFVTDYNFKLIDVDVTKIELAEQVIDEHSISEREADRLAAESSIEEINTVKTEDGGDEEDEAISI